MATDREDVSRAGMVETALRLYRSPDERVGMRSGMGDAAGICDAVAMDIAAEHTYGNGRITKRGQELAAIAKRCGDAVWRMRQMVPVHDRETV